MDGSEARPQRQWTFTPEEREYLRGVGDVATARKVGLFLAVLVGSGVAVLAMESLRRGHDTEAYWHLAEGTALIVLGLLMHRGERWASLVLMMLFSVDPTAMHLVGHLHGTAYPADGLGPWPLGSLLAWACWMRVYYVAYRLERRAATAGG